MCDGQLLSIAENDALYDPDGHHLRRRRDQHLRRARPARPNADPQGTKNGQTYVLGQKTGVEAVTLIATQLPSHTHPFFAASTTGNVPVPTAATMISNQGPTGSGVFGYAPYNAGNTQIALTAASTTPAGGSQPHDNMQPYLGINFILAIAGIYPSQN